MSTCNHRNASKANSSVIMRAHVIFNFNHPEIRNEAFYYKNFISLFAFNLMLQHDLL